MISGIIQARMASTRLPGKTLIEIQGSPVLSHIIDRVKASKYINKIVVATSTNRLDDKIEKVARNKEIDVFRGSEVDVLDRFYKCANQFNPELIVRITADDPFKDPLVIDKAIEIMLSNGGLDYVSNTLKPSYPEGIDVEVFKFESLESAWKTAGKHSEREHVTPYIWNNPQIFTLFNFENEKDLSGLRWTLDTEADLKFVKLVYDKLYKPGRIFLMDDILELLKKEPGLKEINSSIERNHGYKKTVSEEDR